MPVLQDLTPISSLHRGANHIWPRSCDLRGFEVKNETDKTRGQEQERRLNEVIHQI